MLEQCLGHVGDALGEERSLGVNVYRLAPQATKRLRRVHIDGQLHTDLGLADPRHARKLCSGQAAGRRTRAARARVSGGS